MVGVRKRGEEIRQFILDKVEEHPEGIAKVAGEAFSISRQAVNRHIQHLVAENLLSIEGATRSRRYRLNPLLKWGQTYALDGSLEEDRVWRNDIAPRLGPLPKNVLDIWHYGFTEILNNAIDHSSGSFVDIILTKTATASEICINDDGEGIFKKIQNALELHDERHAVLELAKGKLTTDPANHSGEGIFFTSRAFNEFHILSGTVFFLHKFNEEEDWISESREFVSGTSVLLRLKNNATQTLKEVFDKFTSNDEDYGFTKTTVPVRLAQYGEESLVSRSQAKRLLARIEKFKTVLFDFTGVSAIGQAFADEIFRVFAGQHPDIELTPIHANPDVQKMITRATQSDKP
jgi:hypothetical protein